MSALSLLTLAVALGFIGVGCASVFNWRQNRGQTNGYLALALGSLGTLGLVGLVRDLVPGTSFEGGLSALDQVIFMGSGVALLLVRDSVLPLRPRLVRAVMVLAGVSTASVVAASAAAATTRLPGVSGLAGAAGLAYVLTWCFCVGEPILRFWHVAARQTAVQKARLHALSLGYSGIVVVLLLAFGSSLVAGPHASAQVRDGIAFAVQAVSLLTLPLLYVSLVPPARLRAAWRRGEEDAMRRANRELLMFSPDSQTLATNALRWAVRMIGADAGVISDTSGEILARTGLTVGEAEQLVWEAPAGTGNAGGLHRTPLAYGGGEGALILLAGPFTPLLGREEVDTLAEYAASLAVALDRVRMVESLGQQTRENQALLAAISDMGEGVVVTQGTRFVFANDAYLQMVGYTAAELRGMDSMAEMVASDSPTHYDSALIRKDGTVVDVEIGVTDLAGAGVGRTIAIVRDISERKRTELQLRRLGQTDSLTGIANRHAWEDALASAVVRASRDGTPMCLAMLDLDRFKAYNDDWGHQRGDRLLVDLVQAWRRVLRDADALFRYGGDEFALLLPACDIDAALEVLHRVCEAVPERQSVSAGVAQWDGSEAASRLVARADAALYQGKRRNVRVSVGLSDDGASQPVSWTGQLMALVREGAMESVYQPIVSLQGRNVVGYEALARPLGGSADLSVEELFSAAQRLGFARDLDWLGRRAAVQGAHAIHEELLFVNVGLWSLLDPLHDVDQMLLLLQWAGRAPESVVLEMSEREVVSDVGRLREVLASYREAGFRFALDDVGEGHSTFEVLAAADAEFIKVARSLTHRAAEPGAGSAIRALANFAASTGARVIAEGIEDDAMASQMEALGVDLGQGFGLGRPRRLALPGTYAGQAFSASR